MPTARTIRQKLGTEPRRRIQWRCISSRAYQHHARRRCCVFFFLLSTFHSHSGARPHRGVALRVRRRAGAPPFFDLRLGLFGGVRWKCTGRDRRATLPPRHDRTAQGYCDQFYLRLLLGLFTTGFVLEVFRAPSLVLTMMLRLQFSLWDTVMWIDCEINLMGLCYLVTFFFFFIWCMGSSKVVVEFS